MRSVCIRAREGLLPPLVAPALLATLLCLTGCAGFKQFLHGGEAGSRAHHKAGASTPLAPSKVGTPNRGSANSDERYRITGDKLDSLLLDFADRYRGYLVTAWQEVERAGADEQHTADAHRRQLRMVSGMYDMVTRGDPFQKLVNVTMVVTLQSRMYADETIGHEWFGQRADYVMQALRKARVEIWEIAAQVMLPGQLQTLDYLIWDWRRRNPEVNDIASLRFDALSASRSKLAIEQVNTGTGLLAPIKQVSDEVARTRELADRVFYMTKRMPTLVNWQVEDAVNEVLTKPQVQGVTDTVQRLPGVVRREREAIFNGLTNQETAITALLNKVERTADRLQPVLHSADRVVVDLHTTSASLQETAQTVDQLIGGNQAKAKDPNAKPFDIDKYVAAADKFTALAVQLDRTLDSANQLLASNAWQARAADINSVASQQLQRAGNEAEGVIDHTFWRALILMLVFFVLLALYRLFSVRVTRRYAGAGR
jgi:hypothetical protein